MNWLAIVILVLVFGGISIKVFTGFHNYYDSVGETIIEILLTALLSCILTTPIFCLSLMPSLPRSFTVKEKVTHTEYLVQAQVGSKIEGYGGIFVGRIDEETVYRFYVKSGEGYRMDYLYADTSEIIETDETPRVEYFDKVIFECKPSWWQRNFFTEKCWNRLCTKEKDHTGIIYIPTGTIIQSKFDNMNL